MPEARCTIYLSTATFLRFCLRKCKPDDFKTLRILAVGAEKLPPSLAEEFQREVRRPPLEGYGCTELSPVVAANVPTDVEELTQVGNKAGTIGQPLPGVAARSSTPRRGEPLPPGEEGCCW